jgi:hypothetical protein
MSGWHHTHPWPRLHGGKKSWLDRVGAELTMPLLVLRFPLFPVTFCDDGYLVASSAANGV